jgi:CRP/FNR family cyclic AMP-dependent transcriptional regulator
MLLVRPTPKGGNMSAQSDASTLITDAGAIPKLIFVNGSDQRAIVLDHTPFTIGRQSGKDLVITDARVSRDHAIIHLEGDAYVLVDVGSKQGTYVNGEKIDRRKLQYNDRVEFGFKGGPYAIFNPINTEQVEVLKELTATSRVSIFSKLSPGDIQELSKLVTVKKYAPDTAVFFQGEQSDSLYMLLKGSVKVTESSSEGKETMLDILGAGEIFGEFAMLDGHPRSATVTTCEPTELASISRRDFRNFADTRPEILWKVLAALCERLRKASARTLELSSREVPYRLLAGLNQLAEKHGQIAADGSCMINVKFGIDDLTAMVGSNREIVSRLLHRYQEEGLVELGKDKQLIIPDPAALARAIEYASEWS